MADVRTRKTIIVEMDLEENEAQYLKNLLENYLGDSLLDEPKDDYVIREGLFYQLRSALGDTE